MAEMPDVVSGEIIESEWGNDIRDRTLQRYSNVAERSALNASPTPGDLSFLEDTGQVHVYFGGSWRLIAAESLTGGDVNTGTIPTALSILVSLTFNPPTHWNTFGLVAWGSVHGSRASGTTPVISMFGVVRLGLSSGTQFGAQITTTTVGDGQTLGVNHRVSGITGATAVALEGRRVGDPVSYQAVINYTATRLT